MSKYVAAAAVVAALIVPSVALTAQKPVGEAASVTKTFSIDAIDHSARVVTLKGADGTTTDIVCGPEVKRFDALKVGDKVTFTYRESVVSAIKPAGAAATPANAAVTRTPGSKPGATIAQQQSAIVTIDAIDPKVPSVTVKSSDGRKMSFKVENKKNIEGYKAGDRVEITYTQALAISVK
jgi:Cu/Ag efflux protein CusF